MWITQRMLYKKQVFTLRDHLGSSRFLIGSVKLILFSVLCFLFVSGLSILDCSFGFL